MREETQEKIGCIVMLIIGIATMAFLWWRADRQTNIGIKKLDYCIEHKLTNAQCRAIWPDIKVKD